MQDYLLFSKILCHMCSFRGQFVAFPFVVLLNGGIFSFFNGLHGFRTFYFSSKFLTELQYFWQGLSTGGHPKAGQMTESLLHGQAERWGEAFGSALVSHCFNGH